jgi:hypothetical protein
VLRRLRTALAERLARQAAAPERPDDTLNPIA